MRHFLQSASYFNFLKYITSMPDANATANIVVLIFCHFCLCLMINSYRFFHYKSFGDLFCRLCRIPFMRNLIATVNSEKDDAKKTHTHTEQNTYNIKILIHITKTSKITVMAYIKISLRCTFKADNIFIICKIRRKKVAKQMYIEKCALKKYKDIQIKNQKKFIISPHSLHAFHFFNIVMCARSWAKPLSSNICSYYMQNLCKTTSLPESYDKQRLITRLGIVYYLHRNRQPKVLRTK